jgi:hypothetical protein
MVGLQSSGIGPFPSAAAGFLAAFGLRALAILRGWSLPTFPPRD